MLSRLPDPSESVQDGTDGKGALLGQRQMVRNAEVFIGHCWTDVKHLDAAYGSRLAVRPIHSGWRRDQSARAIPRCLRHRHGRLQVPPPPYIPGDHVFVISFLESQGLNQRC